MINYLVEKNILSIHIFLSTMTGYVIIGLIDNITLPFFENCMSEDKREILYYRFLTKLTLSFIVILSCLQIEKSFGV